LNRHPLDPSLDVSDPVWKPLIRKERLFKVRTSYKLVRLLQRQVLWIIARNL